MQQQGNSLTVRFRFFFNEGDDEQEEEEQQSYEDPSPRTREIKWFHEHLDWSLHL